jgi:glycine cleavage system H protein
MQFKWLRAMGKATSGVRMSEYRFTPEHEWLRLESDGSVVVGITDFAQDALGDVVFIQLPELGTYQVGNEVVVLESVKAASNITMPIDGEIVELNNELETQPERVNQAPLSKGWFFRLRPSDPTAVANLLDQAAYDALIAGNA